MYRGDNNLKRRIVITHTDNIVGLSVQLEEYRETKRLFLRGIFKSVCGWVRITNKTQMREWLMDYATDEIDGKILSKFFVCSECCDVSSIYTDLTGVSRFDYPCA